MRRARRALSDDVVGLQIIARLRMSLDDRAKTRSSSLYRYNGRPKLDLSSPPSLPPVIPDMLVQLDDRTLERQASSRFCVSRMRMDRAA